MRLKYNAVLSDCDITGIAEEEFLNWLGGERRDLLKRVMDDESFTDFDTRGIDLSAQHFLFTNVINNIGTTVNDSNNVFKILVEYVILFRHSSNTESLGEYLSFHLDNEVLGFNLAIETERLFKELISYIIKYEEFEDTLIPYNWDDNLNRLIVISKRS